MYCARHKKQPVKRFGGARSYLAMMAAFAGFTLLVGLMTFVG